MMRWREYELGTWQLPTPAHVHELIHSLEKIGVRSYAYRQMVYPQYIYICYRSEQDLASLIQIKANQIFVRTKSFSDPKNS